jgi:prepilin signal peptidase PulO-like enzyme (type II secretory pathway)
MPFNTMEQIAGGIIIFFIFLFGLIIGSFLNCFIWRVRNDEGMMDRSYCPKCKHKLAWYENIPLLSYLFLKGKCRHCRRAISIQYPLVELVVGLLFALSFIVRYQFAPEDVQGSFFLILAGDWFVISVLTFIFVYDFRWYLILDKIVLPSCLVVLVLNLMLGAGWLDLVISAIIGSGFFLLQFVVSRGMWIGGGDIRLGLFMGLVLADWRHLLVALFLAYLLGSIVAIPLILAKKKRWGEKIPFGVFLSTATLIAIFWADDLLNWYLGYLGI